MKRRRKKIKSLSLHVYGILDKTKKEVTKVSLDREEIQLEIDLDNHNRNFSLCDFLIKVHIPD